MSRRAERSKLVEVCRSSLTVGFVAAVIGVVPVCWGQATAPSVEGAGGAGGPGGAVTRPTVATESRWAPGLYLELKVPVGWRRVRWASGFEDKASGGYVTVTEFPLPVEAARRALSPGGVLLKGYTVDRRENASIGGRDAVLVKGTQGSANGVDVKYWLMFGNATKSVLVTGRYSQEQEAKLEPIIRSVLLSANWNPEATPAWTARLPYTVKVPEGLKLAGTVGDRLLYTESGRMARSVTQANMTLFVTSREGKPAFDESEAKKDFDQLSAGRAMKTVEFRKFKPAGGDGLEAYEGVGTVEVNKDLSVTLYLCQVYDPEADATYSVFGQCESKEADQWLTALKDASRSLKLRPDAELEKETLSAPVPPPPPPPPPPAAAPAVPPSAPSAGANPSGASGSSPAGASGGTPLPTSRPAYRNPLGDLSDPIPRPSGAGVSPSTQPR